MAAPRKIAIERNGGFIDQLSSLPCDRMTRRTIARREAIARLALGGFGVAAPAWVGELAARALEHAHGRIPQRPVAGWKPKVLTAHQNETVATISELIIPQTDTAGARAAGVHEFIDEVIADATPATRNSFLNGLSWIDQRCRSRYGVDFIKATADQQVALLTPLSRPADPTEKTRSDKESAYVPTQPVQQERADVPPRIALDFFSLMKSLTITGYYTSEIGMREELGDDGSVFFEDYAGCTDPHHSYEPGK